MTLRNTMLIMSNPETFGARLRRLRRQTGWTQEELAARLGLDRSSVACYEGGRRTPDVHMAAAIAAVLGVSVDFLLGTKGEAVQDDDIAYLLRSTGELSEADRKQLLDFADWLRTRKKGVRPKT